MLKSRERSWSRNVLRHHFDGLSLGLECSGLGLGLGLEGSGLGLKDLLHSSHISTRRENILSVCFDNEAQQKYCLLYTSPSPRD